MGKQGDSHLFLPAIIKVRLAPASKINQREKLLLAVAHCKAPFILKEDHIASKLDSYLIMSGDKNLGTSSPLPFTLRVRCPPASAGSSRQNDLPPGVDGKEATTLSEDHKVPKFESDLKSAPTSTDPEVTKANVTMLEEGLHDRLQFDSDDGGQPSDTSYVRLLAAGKPEQGLIRFIEGSDSSDLWSTQGLASICSDSEDITRKRDAHPSRQVFGQSVADPKGVESIMKDSCHICEDVITWESPGDATPCCGRLVHDQCNYEAIEECGKCPACGWVQESSKNAVTTAPLEPQEYMFRFGDRDRSTQTNGPIVVVSETEIRSMLAKGSEQGLTDGASEVETMGLDLELHRMNESIKSTPKFRCPICGDDFALEIPDMETPCCHLLTHTFCNDETLKENGRCWNCNANQISSKFPASVASSKGPNYMYQRGRGPNTKLKESRGSSKQTCRMTLKEFLRKYPHGTQPGRSPWPREAVASRKPSEKHPDTHHVSTVPKECEKAEAVQHLNDATDRLVQACVLYASKVTEEEKTRILGKILEGLSGSNIKDTPTLNLVPNKPALEPNPTLDSKTKAGSCESCVLLQARTQKMKESR